MNLKISLSLIYLDFSLTSVYSFIIEIQLGGNINEK